MRRARRVLLAFVVGLLPALWVFGPAAAQPAMTVTVGQDGYTCDYDGLTDAMIAASSGYTIQFDCPGSESTITMTGPPFGIIGRTLTIDGSNLGGNQIILDGDGQYAMFTILGFLGPVELTVQNLTFKDGFGDDHGGAIYNEGTLNVINSTFINNSVKPSATETQDGGAIYSSGPLTVTGSHFERNTAQDGGAIYLYEIEAPVSITNSTFVTNHVSDDTPGGGASDGGAIFNDGNGNPDVDDTVTITNSTFTGNMAGDDGGAVYNSRAGNMAITGSTFTSNKAIPRQNEDGGLVSGDGGAIHNLGAMEIRNSTFESNVGSLSDAGAIYNDTQLTIIGSRFVTNQAEDEGGAVHNTDDGEVTIEQSTFSGNTASVDGGALQNDGEMTITNSDFANNRALTDDGGAIEHSGPTLQIESSIFTGNQSSDDGGAIYNDRGLTVTGSTFTSNQSNSNGGAIYSYNDGNLTVEQSSFVSNTADNDGGAIMNRNGILKISQSSFVENSTGDTGGAIHNDGEMTLTTSTFSVNSADGEGSAIMIDPTDTSTAISWSTIVQDSAPAISAGTDLTLTGVILAGPSDNCALTGTVSTDDSFSISDDESCQLSSDPELGLVLGARAMQEIGGVEQTYYPLVSVGPAVDAGGSSCGSVDQLGNDRPVGNACDIGAVEGLTVVIEPAHLCANRWTGELRMPRYGHCANTETQLSLPADGALTLCANRWTGEARYSQYGRCRTTETAYTAIGDNSISVCVNRWDGTLRISQRCYNTEQSDAI